MTTKLLTPEQLAELDQRIEARANTLIAARTKTAPKPIEKTTSRGRPTKSICNPFFSFIGHGTTYERYPPFAMDIIEGIARLDWHDRPVGGGGKSMPLSVRNLTVILESLPVVSTTAVGELLRVEVRHSQRYVKAISLILHYMLKARPQTLVDDMSGMQAQDAA